MHFLIALPQACFKLDEPVNLDSGVLVWLCKVCTVSIVKQSAEDHPQK